MWAVFGIWKMLEDQKHFVTNFGAHLTYQIFHVPLSFSLPENHLAIEPIGPRNVRDKGKNQGKIVSLLTWYQLPNIYLGGNGTNVLEFLMRILITFSQNLKQPWVENVRWILDISRRIWNLSKACHEKSLYTLGIFNCFSNISCLKSHVLRSQHQCSLKTTKNFW